MTRVKKTKQIKLAILSLALLASSVFALTISAPSLVYADHDSCTSNGGSIDSMLRCAQEKEEAAIEECTSNGGSIDSMSRCLEDVDEHFTPEEACEEANLTDEHLSNCRSEVSQGCEPEDQDCIDKVVEDSSTAQQEGSGNTDQLGEPSRLDSDCEDINNCQIIGYLKDFINVLSAVVGIVIAIMFAVRGIQYMTARDNAQQVSAAKGQFFWLVIALVVYLFTFSFLQWLVPGGIF